LGTLVVAAQSSLKEVVVSIVAHVAVENATSSTVIHSKLGFPVVLTAEE
jgi:hypothetical protein